MARQATPLLAAVAGVYARGGVVGGTSAGCAISGRCAYDAVAAGSRTLSSRDALYDPFDPAISFSRRVFASPLWASAITDTHSAARDRMGRARARALGRRIRAAPAARRLTEAASSVHHLRMSQQLTDGNDDTLPPHVRHNRAYWDDCARDYVEAGRRDWARDEPAWGIYAVPESVLHVLPPREELAGRDTIELGCGTAYVSAWLHRRGARPVGIDNSPEQLRTARALQKEFAIEFPLHLGNAEDTGLPAASFDLAISEYGAAIWCDPYRWIPEAARLLRPGGQLIFLGNSTLMMLCMPEDETQPAGDRLLRPQAGMHRFTWPEPSGVEFHISPGDWIRLLRKHGFIVEDLIEVYPGPEATTRYSFASLDWSRRFPCEEIWKARKLP